MPISQARIATDRPSRFLVQFCKHADAIGSRRGHRLRMHGGVAAARGEVTVGAHWSDTVGRRHHRSMGPMPAAGRRIDSGGADRSL